MRKFHRWIGLGSLFFLGLAAVTGLLWAYAPYLYWKDGYLQKKNVVPSPPLSAVSVTVKDALREAERFLGPNKEAISLTLKAEMDRLLYEIQFRANRKTQSILVDGSTGKVLSPVAESFAMGMASQYVVDRPPIRSVERVVNYQHRNGKSFESVYVVRFATPLDPELVVDGQSGAVIEDLDRIRKFHFWVIKLHQLKFFGFKKELVILPGLSLIFMGLSGFLIWWGVRKRKKQTLT